jgi:hypothetical protein
MTAVPHQSLSPDAIPDYLLVRELTRQLAAAGLGVQYTLRLDECRLAILGAATGPSMLALAAARHARWLYEPVTGLSTSPATLTAIIAYLLAAPAATGRPADYHALPLKGQVGRTLQDRRLAVTLRVSEDWDSFEATTDIDITNPTQPQLGTITLSDDGVLDWRFDWQAAFQDNPVALIDVIIPILRAH